MMNSVAFAPEGAADGGGDTSAADSAAAAADAPLLTGVTESESSTTDGEGSGAASDWQEYQPDASKSDEENAAAKAEHDKAKPKEDADKSKQEPKDPADLVPEDGKYDIKLEGGIELDQALLERAAPVMKELGLTHSQASKLAGVIAEQRKIEHDALSERQQKITSDWQQEIRTDKDFGGENLTASLNNANRVIATFGDDALKRDLVEIGMGNHPGLFRLLASVGNALSDDKPASSETAAAPPVSPEQAMYGATTPTTRG
jgi:antitoxin component of RelBE/YafQ-DinJ toxin-antitoxin module